VATRLPFLEQLRYKHELRGWSQANLAEKVGCNTKKTVGRWESGDSFPRPYHRQSLCEIFGKNAEELGLLKEKPRNIQPLSSPSLFNVSEASLFPTLTTAPWQPLLLKEARASDQVSLTRPRADWGEAPYVVNPIGVKLRKGKEEEKGGRKRSDKESLL